MLRKEHGGQESNNASDEILYKIDIPANRYDMLCLEGIARALNIFNRRLPVPQYRLADMTGAECCRCALADYMQYWNILSSPEQTIYNSC